MKYIAEIIGTIKASSHECWEATINAKAIILECITIAREEADKEEARLGRTLTEAEIGAIATMVEQQLKAAVAMVRL